MTTTNPSAVEPAQGDALVLVDVQCDFLPGGSLAVPKGDEIIPVLNRYLAAFSRRGLPIFATRDWHPPSHCSFKNRGGQWPVHCVANTPGAAFPAALKLPPEAVVISKARFVDRDAYSGFDRTELEARLRLVKARRLFIGGLATDYCVLHTVRDALDRGFKVFLLCDAIRAVNLRADDGAKAEAEMLSLGALPLLVHELAA
ncbi:MAG: isochorismatase family protein [Gemmatales bacterium]|nr:isochorismatase family protein [Gemmatales bacterium]